MDDEVYLELDSEEEEQQEELEEQDEEKEEEDEEEEEVFMEKNIVDGKPPWLSTYRIPKKKEQNDGKLQYGTKNEEWARKRGMRGRGRSGLMHWKTRGPPKIFRGNPWRFRPYFYRGHPDRRWQQNRCDLSPIRYTQEEPKQFQKQKKQQQQQQSNQQQMEGQMPSTSQSSNVTGLPEIQKQQQNKFLLLKPNPIGRNSFYFSPHLSCSQQANDGHGCCNTITLSMVNDVQGKALPLPLKQFGWMEVSTFFHGLVMDYMLRHFLGRKFKREEFEMRMKTPTMAMLEEFYLNVVLLGKSEKVEELWPRAQMKMLIAMYHQHCVGLCYGLSFRPVGAIACKQLEEFAFPALAQWMRTLYIHVDECVSTHRRIIHAPKAVAINIERVAVVGDETRKKLAVFLPINERIERELNLNVPVQEQIFFGKGVTKVILSYQANEENMKKIREMMKQMLGARFDIILILHQAAEGALFGSSWTTTKAVKEYLLKEAQKLGIGFGCLANSDNGEKLMNELGLNF